MRETEYCGYFDGASRGNPGDAGAGACLIDAGGRMVWEYAEYLGHKTNNEAEYAALLALLAEAKRRGITRLTVKGDSKLVVCQVGRSWKINKPHLLELAEKAWQLMEGLSVKLEWIPRELNSQADALSNRGIDNK